MSKKNSASRNRGPYQSKAPSAAEVYARKARQHYHEKQSDRALTLLEQAIAIAPQNALFHQEMGKWLVAGKRTAEGVSYYEKSLDLNPDFVPALIELGQEHVKKNDFDSAQPLLERALALQAEHPAANIVYGTFLQKQGRLPEAVEYLRNALEFKLRTPHKAGQPRERRPAFNKAETERLMWRTLSELAKAGVHAFASYGTLLGLVRDGSLLPHDKDIDFGLPHCEMERASRCLESNGWIESQNKFLTNPRAFFNPAKGVSLDLSGFVVDEVTGETFSGFWLNNVPTEWQRHTRYIDIHLEKNESPEGEPIWALCDPEAWLVTIYGEDWEIPDTDFDTVIAAKNLCDFSLLTQTYAFARIYSQWEKGQIRKALALTRHTRQHLPSDVLMQTLENHLQKMLPAQESPPNHQPTLRAHRTPLPRNAPIDLEELDEQFGKPYEHRAARTLNFES